MWLIQIRALRKKVAINFKKKRSEWEREGWVEERQGDCERGQGQRLAARRAEAMQGGCPVGQRGIRHSDTVATAPGTPASREHPCDSYVCLGQASSHSRVRGRVGSGDTLQLWGLPHSAHRMPGGDGGGEDPSQLPLFHT